MNLYQSYKQDLLNSIPVVSGMEVDILEINDQAIVLEAPLDTNINYEGTAFGGSLNTLCILSCYLLVHHTLKLNKVEFSSLVIQDSSIRYIRPVDKNFKAISSVSDKGQALLLKLIDQKGIGRINVVAHIKVDGDDEPRVVFNGRFVASK